MSTISNSVSWGADVSDKSLSPVAVSANNEQAYLLTSSGSIHYYNSANIWTQVDCPFVDPSTFVSVGYDGSVFTILKNSQAYLLNDNGWEMVSASVLCGAVGDNSSYVISETDETVTIVNHGIPQNVYAPYTLKQITTTVGNKHIWALDVFGFVYSWDNDVWKNVGTKQMSRIHVSLSSSNSPQVCAVDTDGFGWVFNFSNLAWETVNHPGAGRLVSLEANHNTIWATLSSGEIYQGYF